MLTDLVLEPWIRPSLFDQFVGQDSPAVDEYTFCLNLGADEAAAQLQTHWAEWYTEADFENFAAWGLNHVRIPIGYWAFDVQSNEPWVQGQEEYLQLALVWATTYGINVWIDLHGAPGSQNGTNPSSREIFENTVVCLTRLSKIVWTDCILLLMRL